jgi:hypothetical protein
MHASNHRPDRLASAQLRNVLERIDQARVTAAQDHHDSFRSFEEEALVI